MPWDPAPTPVASSPAPAPANVQRPPPQPQQLPGPTAVPTTSVASSSSGGGVHIKTEPGTSYDLQNLPPTNGASVPVDYGNQIASQRAAAALQAKFGTQANASLSAMSARATLAAPGAQPPARPQNAANALPLTEEQRRQREQYLRAQQAHHQQAQQRQQTQAQAQYQALQQSHQRAAAAVSKAQTDGAADWDAMVAQRRTEALSAASGSSHADLTIRQQVELMGHDMEGGGLMRPLSEHGTQHKRRKVLSPPNRSSNSIQVSSFSPALELAQTDGPNDSDDDDDDDDGRSGIKDEDLDEDAINSDLDDPDDNAVDETGEEGKEGEVMLCTYDKVARVKNKWKCTLKDGVLTTGGKE